MTGQELRTLRKAQNPKVSQEKLADLIGVARFTVSRYERGELPISKAVEIAIKAVLKY